MLEVRGNIFDLITTDKYDAFCITTNGFVKSNGECVMGRGIALECKQRFPNLPLRAGDCITHNGNHSNWVFNIDKVRVFIFPVKHNWWEQADIKLIERSCQELMGLADRFKLNSILLPRPGCGNGHLNWNDVKPIIEPLLDNRVIVASF